MFSRYSRSGLALMGVPLYAGPLLAGWAEAPWQVPAVIAGIFFLMQALRGVDTGATGAAVGIAILAVVQVAVVAVVYGVGLLIAMAVGPLAVPLWMPPALSAAGAAVGILRYRKNPKEEEMWEVIDKAIDAIETGAALDFGDEDFDAGAVDPDPEAEEAARAALEELWSLPEQSPIFRVDAIVEKLNKKVRHRAWHALQAEGGEGFRTVDLALLRYATIPEVRAELVNSADLGFAMSVLIDSDDEGVLTELAALTLTLLDEGAPASELPPPGELRDKAALFPVLAPLVDRVEAEYEKWQAAFA